MMPVAKSEWKIGCFIVSSPCIKRIEFRYGNISSITNFSKQADVRSSSLWLSPLGEPVVDEAVSLTINIGTPCKRLITITCQVAIPEDGCLREL